MKRITLVLFVASVVLSGTAAWAQSPSVGEAIEPILPGLTVRVVRESPRDVDGRDLCDLSFQPFREIPWECSGGAPFPTVGFDAAGNAYHVPDSYGLGVELEPYKRGNHLRRVSPTGVMEDVARVVRRHCLVPTCREKIDGWREAWR